MSEVAPMVMKRWRFVVEDMDRHGNVRLYLRRKGHPKVRLPDDIHSKEFADAYHAAMAGVSPKDGRPVLKPSSPQTFRWLCEQYYRSADYRRLDVSTKAKRKAILEGCWDEPLKPGSSDTMGDCPIARFIASHVKVLRDRKMDTPEAANGRIKIIRRVFAFACGEEELDIHVNPARDVDLFKTGSEGFHTWTMPEIERYQAAYPLGTKQRLALALLMFTGQRKSDIIVLGRQHETAGGELHFTQVKNAKRKPVRIEIPILPELREAIQACPSDGLTFLLTDHGKPFTSAGFGNRFRQWCDAAGLDDCSSHGLRKAGASIAAENGATEHQLMAIFGWSDSRQPAHYTRKANRRKMARSGMHHLVPKAGENGNEVSHFPGPAMAGGTDQGKR